MNALNAWKILSISLMVVLATGFVAPQAYADVTSTILSVVQNIQSQVNNTTYGLKAIQNNVNTKASQTSVNSLQTATNSIKPNALQVDNTFPLTCSITFKCNAEVNLLPHIQGVAYSGHLTLIASPGTTIGAHCISYPSTSISFGAGNSVNEDFSCYQLNIALQAPVGTMNTLVQGTVTYQNATITSGPR